MSKDLSTPKQPKGVPIPLQKYLPQQPLDHLPLHKDKTSQNISEGSYKVKTALWSLIKKIFLKMYKGLSTLELSITKSHLSSLKTFLSHQDPEIRKLVVLIIATRMKFQKSFRKAWVQHNSPTQSRRINQIVISSYANEKAQVGLQTRFNSKKLPFNQATLFFSANNMMQVKSFDEFELGKIVISKKLDDVPDARYAFIWFDLEIYEKIMLTLENNEDSHLLDERIRRMQKTNISRSSSTNNKSRIRDGSNNTRTKYSQFTPKKKVKVLDVKSRDQMNSSPFSAFQSNFWQQKRKNTFFTPSNTTKKSVNFEFEEEGDDSPLDISPSSKSKKQYSIKSGQKDKRNFSISRQRPKSQKKSFSQIIKKLRAVSVVSSKKKHICDSFYAKGQFQPQEGKGSFIIKKQKMTQNLPNKLSIYL